MKIKVKVRDAHGRRLWDNEDQALRAARTVLKIGIWTGVTQTDGWFHLICDPY